MYVEVLPGAEGLLAEVAVKLPLALVRLGVRGEGGRVLEALPAFVARKVSFAGMQEANVPQEVASVAETLIAMLARVRSLGGGVVRPGLRHAQVTSKITAYARNDPILT